MMKSKRIYVVVLQVSPYCEFADWLSDLGNSDCSINFYRVFSFDVTGHVRSIYPASWCTADIRSSSVQK